MGQETFQTSIYIFKEGTPMSHHLHLIWNLLPLIERALSQPIPGDFCRKCSVWLGCWTSMERGYLGKIHRRSMDIWGRIPRGHAEPFARTRPWPGDAEGENILFPLRVVVGSTTSERCLDAQGALLGDRTGAGYLLWILSSEQSWIWLASESFSGSNLFWTRCLALRFWNQT